MKKDYKVIFLSVIFLLTVFSFVSFVNAQSGDNVIKNLFGNAFEEFKTSWTSGVWGEGFGKILLGLLILFIIWGLLDATRFIRNAWINFAIAAVVAFFSSAYLLPSEIISLTQTYSALGLTIGVIIPFFAMALFTFGAIRSGDAFSLWVQRFIWVIFTLFLLYRLGVSLDKASGFVSLVIGITAVASLIAAIMNRNLVRSINRALIQSMRGRTQREQAAARTVEQERARAAPGSDFSEEDINPLYRQ